MTTGITVPVSACVWALNALQNSMMLMPCWPSAGPTGGAGDACPPTACSLISVRTFLAMLLPMVRRYARLDLLDLVEADLDRRLAAEDRHQDLELGRVLVDLGDLSREVRQRARDDLDRLADLELCLRRGLGGDLAVQQAVDLGLRERDRLVRRPDEAGHAGRALDELPGVVVELHVHEDVAGHGPLLHGRLLVVLQLRHRLGRDDDVAHGPALVQRLRAMLQVLLDLVLVSGVGVDDVPAIHGFLRASG